MIKKKKGITKIVKLSEETHARLAKHGTGIGATYDDVIRKLLDFYEEKHDDRK